MDQKDVRSILFFFSSDPSTLQFGQQQEQQRLRKKKITCNSILLRKKKQRPVRSQIHESKTTIMDSTTETLKPNEFAIPDGEAYAKTQIEAWEIMDFLTKKLETINTEELDPDNLVCAICLQDFGDFKADGETPHGPVKTVCGHVFGKGCIIGWLDPLSDWGVVEEDVDEAAAAVFDPLYAATKKDCPLCKRVLVPECLVEPMEALAQRLTFWDMAYASAGVARSAKEERTRKTLWEYVEYCRAIDDNEISAPVRFEFMEASQFLLSDFAASLENQQLTREQERVRMRLERIGRKDLEKCAFANGLFEFDIDSDENERSEFEPEPESEPE